MQEGAAGLRGGAFCGQGEHLCRGRPALGLPIAARWRWTVRKERKKVVADEKESPRAPTSARGRRVPHPRNLFSADGRPRARRRSSGPDLGDQNSKVRPAARANHVSIFALVLQRADTLAGNGQRGQRNLVDEALAKRSKCDDTIEQKLLLRCATQKSNGGVSWLMLAITWSRSGRTCAPARWLESYGRMLPHCARASSCRGLLAARRRPERGSTCLCVLRDSLSSRGDPWLSSHFGFGTL